jgi:hypothetical protein
VFVEAEISAGAEHQVVDHLHAEDCRRREAARTATSSALKVGSPDGGWLRKTRRHTGRLAR